METRIRLPETVEYILNQLFQNNHEAYVVGGCVRDSIMGKEPHDWDICTSALPEEIMSVFKDYQIIPTGLKHGTVTVVVNNESYEITTYRTESKYSDNRHPDKVEFVSDLKEDLQRRDFTINAMAYNHTNGLIDPFDGMKDIREQVIRCVGNADDRFNEDALRILRAIRFSARLDYSIDSATLKSIQDNKHLLSNISKERINSEISQIILCDFRHFNSRLALKCLVDILPSVVSPGLLCGIDYKKIDDKFDDAERDLETRLALLFPTPNINLILYELRFSNHLINTATYIYDAAQRIINEKEEWATNQNNLNRQLSDIWFYCGKLLFEFGFHVVYRAAYLARIFVRYKENYNLSDFTFGFDIDLLSYIILQVYVGGVYKISQLAINGIDLLELGIAGKDVGLTLKELLFSVMKCEIPNERNALISEAEKKKHGGD